MSDLIDRQTAIDAVNTALFPKINTAKDAEKALRALPSAQPEKRTEKRTETHSCDLIDREAAIEALDEIESEVADGYGYQYEKWRKYFCGLPSAQPEQRWIPCSERLPKDTEIVLVSDGIDYAVAFWRSDADAWDDPLHGWLDSFGFEVKAWMPLPEPYKGESIC